MNDWFLITWHSSLEDYMKYKPEEEGEVELDAKTKQYIRMGELLREKTTALTQLIVMWVSTFNATFEVPYLFEPSNFNFNQLQL